MLEDNTLKSKAASAKSATARKAATAKSTPARGEKKHRRTGKTSGKSSDKVKVVRDSFTMPQSDYAKIAALKQVCLRAGLHVKKSELLRAGLHALSKLGTTQLRRAIAQLEQIRTGRPKKA